jgi:hypothetical protein
MDDVSYNVCANCEPNRCPNDPNEEYFHPKGTGPDDCIRCLQAAKQRLADALRPIALVYPSDRMCRACQKVDCADPYCDGFIARKALAELFLVPRENQYVLVERVGGNVQVLREAKTPDADGWWARREDGKVTWYRVQVCDDAGPCVYVSEFHEMVPVAKFTHPLTKWYGPVVLPKDYG